MLGIKKRILYTWFFVTSVSLIFFGIQLVKYWPGIITYTDLITFPLALSFVFTIWYIDKQYDIITSNKTIEIVENYLQTQSMQRTADNLDLNTNTVRRAVLLFIEKALD